MANEVSVKGVTQTLMLVGDYDIIRKCLLMDVSIELLPTLKGNIIEILEVNIPKDIAPKNIHKGDKTIQIIYQELQRKDHEQLEMPLVSQHPEGMEGDLG